MEDQVCTKCKLTKSINEFHKANGLSYRRICKLCCEIKKHGKPATNLKKCMSYDYKSPYRQVSCRVYKDIKEFTVTGVGRISATCKQCQEFNKSDTIELYHNMPAKAIKLCISCNEDKYLTEFDMGVINLKKICRSCRGTSEEGINNLCKRCDRYKPLDDFQYGAKCTSCSNEDREYMKKYKCACGKLKSDCLVCYPNKLCRVHSNGTILVSNCEYCKISKVCSHNKRKYRCKECKLCPHGKDKSYCDECNTLYTLCEHNIQRPFCFTCSTVRTNML